MTSHRLLCTSTCALSLTLLATGCVSGPEDSLGSGDDEWKTATALSASYQGHYRSEESLPIDVHRTQQAVGRYLEENVGCSRVKLCVKNVTPPVSKLFRSKPGTFELELTASCRSELTDFRFDMAPAWDWEDYTDALVGYAHDGQWIERDIVARLSGEDYRRASSVMSVDGCDSSPIDYELPYRIITSERHLRRF
jgi:hypothetical protein